MTDSLERALLWIVWYEDRFGWGPDRDPASVVGIFASEAEALRHVAENEGPHDIAAGKFDGLFIQKWTAAEALGAGLISRERLALLIEGSV